MKYRLFKEINFGENKPDNDKNFIVSVNRDNKIHVYEEITGEVSQFEECNGSQLNQTLERTEEKVVYVVDNNLKICKHYGVVDSKLIEENLSVSADRKVAEKFVENYYK